MTNKHPRWIEHWDDERQIGNSLIVTLARGYSFSRSAHEGVRGFDTVTEAKNATRRGYLHPCACDDCRAAAEATNDH